MSDEYNYTFKSAFHSPRDAYSGRNIRPVIFDVLASDYQTSLLPDDYKLVLHVNPTSMKFSSTKVIQRIQTRGGFVEQHWGEGSRTIAFEMATGGFMRLYSGLSNITTGGDLTKVGSAVTSGRRDTIAYDKYLDMLALFHNNGMVYDDRGEIVFNGAIKCTFDEGEYTGWFNDFTVSESAEKPYQFDLSASFTIRTESYSLKTTPIIGGF